MIAASRRRRPGVESTEEAFRLHLKLARRSGMGRRLVRGSLAALVCSVIALVVGVDLTIHAVVIAVGFMVGFAVPVLGLRQRALAEIRSHAGMSYETALDLLGDEGPPRGKSPGPTELMVPDADPFGLKAAVIDRARHAVADVRPTAAPAWWLPALAVALALLLVSGLDLSGGSGGPGPNGSVSPPSGSSVVPIDGRDDRLDDGDVLAPQDEAPGRAEEPEGAHETPAHEDEGVDRDTAEPAVGAGDGAPMSRFLDSLRERPPEAGGGNQPEQDRASQGAPSAPPGQGRPGGGREGEPERAELPTDPGAQSGDEVRAGGGVDGEGREGGDDVVVAGETDEDGDPQGESRDDEANGQVPGGRQGADNRPAAGGPEDEQGLEQGGAADGAGSDDPAGAGVAGVGGGPESAAGVAEGQAERPEFLRGVLEEGPESPAGAVRLPGQTDVTLPLGGSSPADYAAAAEEALSEGDLPLSYQEIIRRYFR